MPEPSDQLPSCGWLEMITRAATSLLFGVPMVSRSRSQMRVRLSDRILHLCDRYIQSHQTEIGFKPGLLAAAQEHGLFVNFPCIGIPAGHLRLKQAQSIRNLPEALSSSNAGHHHGDLQTLRCTGSEFAMLVQLLPKKSNPISNAPKFGNEVAELHLGPSCLLALSVPIGKEYGKKSGNCSEPSADGRNGSPIQPATSGGAEARHNNFGSDHQSASLLIERHSAMRPRARAARPQGVKNVR